MALLFLRDQKQAQVPAGRKEEGKGGGGGGGGGEERGVKWSKSEEELSFLRRMRKEQER